MLIHHMAPLGFGFLIAIHIKHGKAYVKGNANPPSRTAKLIKNGKATAIKNTNPPKIIRKATRSHLAHGLFSLLEYLNSKLSKTTMP
jgi:hypothetical protein